MKIAAILLFAFTLLLPAGGSAQIEINPEKGSFEDFMPWGDGYLGVVLKQLYAVVPKTRRVQYYDESGKMMWDKEIDPFNNNNYCVVDPNANHAYFLNFSFGATAMAERTSQTTFMSVYQMNKSGQMVEKQIDYAGVLQPLITQESFETSYIGANNNGVVMVFSSGEGYKSFHVIRIDSNLNVKYRAVDFEWDVDRYLKNGISKPKFALNDAHFSMIQLVLETDGIKTICKTLDLNDNLNVEVTTSTLDTKGYALMAGVKWGLIYYGNQITVLSHQVESFSAQGTTITHTLGSRFDFIYSGDKLLALCKYATLNSQKKRYENLGYMVYDIPTAGGKSLAPLHDFGPKGEDENSLAVVLDKDKGFVHVWSDEELITVEDSSGAKKQFPSKKANVHQVYMAFLNPSFPIDKSTKEINRLLLAPKGYVGVEMHRGSSYSVGYLEAVIFK